MKLLIIDDEKLTREGISRNIDWKSLHIHEVLLAKDGMNGLDIALKEHPQIILSDIRMPRLDGIQMAERIHEMLPNTCIIFMSGYSDKEYLKAAIKLRAIRYVEKPIDLAEVKEAVSEAVQSIEIAQRTQQSEEIHHQEQSSRLALSLIQKHGTVADEVKELVKKLNLSIQTNTYFTTCIVQFQESLSELPANPKKDLIDDFADKLSSYNLSCVHAYKGDQFLIFHIFGSTKPTDRNLEHIFQYLQRLLKDICPFFIAPGKTVTGIERVYDSYSSAVILLQSSFFSEYNQILKDRENTTDSQLLSDQVTPFSQALSQKNDQAGRTIINNLYRDLLYCQSLLPSQVKDIYYKYFMQIENAATRFQVSISEESPVMISIWEAISQCNTLNELHNLLNAQLERLFDCLLNTTEENPTIFQIKDFICKNYSNESLSVKHISDHVYLSSSYVSTLFRNETGKTLSQYITDYRIDVAKQLLSDSRYKISDISSQVGYSDNNYFRKTFKKSVGLSPSEYREKMLQ